MSQTLIAKNPRYDFSDLILGGNEGKTVYVKNLHPDSDILSRTDILSAIWRECKKIAYDGNDKATDNGPAGVPVVRDFAIEYVDEEIEVVSRFRVSVQVSVKGAFFCLRRISDKIPTLQEQGFIQPVIDTLLQKDRRGLILFGGEMGSGKTTAASAVVAERLMRNGGSAITLEDPPEYKLQGGHSNPQKNNGCIGGICIQRATTSDKMAEEIPTLMRAGAPEIIFLGEIRDEKAAREAVLAASNGHLVISTIHGKGIDGVITRLVSLSASSSMSYESTSKIIADALSMIIFQTLIRNENTNMKILQTTVADFTNKDNGDGMRKNIRDMKFEQLGSYIKEHQGRSNV